MCRRCVCSSVRSTETRPREQTARGRPEGKEREEIRRRAGAAPQTGRGIRDTCNTQPEHSKSAPRQLRLAGTTQRYRRTCKSTVGERSATYSVLLRWCNSFRLCERSIIIASSWWRRRGRQPATIEVHASHDVSVRPIAEARRDGRVSECREIFTHVLHPWSVLPC